MSKKLVYVLEDDQDISELVNYILSEEGYEVNGCPTIAAFNHMILQRLPDIAILDIMLPDGNGLDICRQLRLDEHTSAINIIMMSANTTQSEIIGSGCGAEFIAKPFNIDHFVTRVNQYA